ncbi:methyltransferase domain-containing protein [Streptomyces sp. NPDC005955]|uniref:methyltransferase domain-containing protein n=1 Tax=Streptomyces sp. NPDC005955 TaxID=3364738 RepID=UPI003682783F
MDKPPATPAVAENPVLALLDRVDTTPEARALRARSYELLGVWAGTRLLDVGCGGGRAVAETVRLGARSTGVDPDRGAVAAARARWPRGRFLVADARALPFPDASVDAYRAERVLHELVEPAEAVTEARRVLAPGGRIALIGHDWDAFVIDSDDARLTRRIVHARADLVVSPRAARGFRALLLAAGFSDVRVEVHTTVLTGEAALAVVSSAVRRVVAVGVVAAEEGAAWVAGQRGRAFVAVPVFLASAHAVP